LLYSDHWPLPVQVVRGSVAGRTQIMINLLNSDECTK